MADALTDPRNGPDALWSEDLAPSRGQHETIARLACELLGQPLRHRLDATKVITRLRLSLGHPDAPRPVLVDDDITEF